MLAIPVVCYLAATDASAMIRSLSVALLLMLGSVLYAQSQVDLYTQAMKAEEAGNVTESVSLFEQALAAGGEYSDEIREILAQYYEALGLTEDGSGSFSLRLQSDVGYFGLRYTEFGAKKDSAGNSTGDVTENGGDIFASLNLYLDYTRGSWTHSFGVTFVSDWFYDNKDMPVLDTNDWNIAPGLEYSLVGRNILLDVGVDFNITSDKEFKPAGYAWIEYDIYKYESLRVGAAALGYYRKDGPTTASLMGSLHRTAETGFNFSAYVGAKYEADYMLNVLDYVEQMQQGGWNWYNYDPESGNQWWESTSVIPADSPLGKCIAERGDSVCWDFTNGVLQWYQEEYGAEYAETLNNQNQWWMTPQDTTAVLPTYWTRWVGPSVRANVSYLFKTHIALEVSLNMFYALVVDGASWEFEKMQKFSGSWGFKASWNPWWFTIYAGVEQTFLDYNLPKELSAYFTERNLLTSLRAGVKVEF